MTQIQPYNPWDADRLAKMNQILLAQPVMNLTQDEVLTTLRFLELKDFLQDGHWNDLVIRKNDSRLELCDDKDRFLAMLADCDKRETILTTKRCRRLFGGSVYYWRKIARKCPIIDVASALSEFGDGGYYGRGWVIALHIERLIDYINNNKTNNNEK